MMQSQILMIIAEIEGSEKCSLEITQALIFKRKSKWQHLNNVLSDRIQQFLFIFFFIVVC